MEASMTREEFKAIPKRDWKEDITDVSGVYILPSGRKHESGWAIMDFVAVKKDGNKIDLTLKGKSLNLSGIYNNPTVKQKNHF